jgi:hypothetical protein
MSDIVLATGVQFSSDPPAGTTGIPRQEWLGAASPSNRSTDDGNSGGSSAIRLVGHKVLAQGAARTPRNRQEPEFAQTADPRRDIEPAQTPSVNSGSLNVYTASMSSGSHATRAIAIFSQQAGSLSGAKGTLIDTYA